MSTANVDDSADSDDGGPSEKRSEVAKRHTEQPHLLDVNNSQCLENLWFFLLVERNSGRGR